MGSPTVAPECSSLLHPSYANLVFSTLLLLGILISYLPQHHRIITRRSSEGISPLFLLLGTTSGTCTFLNILILSWGVLGCCGKGIGGFNCVAASLGVAQVGLQWACFAVILLLFLIYFQPPTQPGQPSYKQALGVTIASVLHFIVMAVGTFYISLLHHAEPDSSPLAPPAPSTALVNWANFLGVQSTVLASIQYLPQIWTTWRLRHVGSLSIPMMCIQTPGSFVFVVSLASREGTRWSSWVTYAVTGCLQGVLLVMCVVWEMRDRRVAKMGGEGERAPLLREQNGEGEYNDHRD